MNRYFNTTHRSRDVQNLKGYGAQGGIPAKSKMAPKPKAEKQ